MTRSAPTTRTTRRLMALLVVLCLAALHQTLLPSAQARTPSDGGAPRAAAQQTLTWTADSDTTRYKSAPATAVAGEATIVFENSVATGNTTGMLHTLTFTTTDPEYNDDVDVNIAASPDDTNGGRHEETVTLTPGVYHYFCSIPGHGQMQGELVVTEGGGGEDTTPPEVSATVDGDQNDAGQYVGSATVILSATDAGSGVDRIEYAVDDGDFAPYEAPILLNTAGTHTVTHRAFDKAGNASDEQTVTVEVVQPSGEDTTPPEASATVDGERNDAGDYLGMATVTLTATDAGSGVDTIEYALNGGAFTEYTLPVMLHSVGDYTVSYRATDNAGNSSEAETVTFTIVEDGGDPPPADCPESDDRPLVMVGDEHTGVPNRSGPDGCTANERIEDEAAWSSHGSFLTHVREVTEPLLADGVIDTAGRTAIIEAADRSDIGEPGNQNGYERIFTGTAQSLDRWAHVGGGAFGLNEDGSITSSPTADGLGMLWFPEQRYGDFSLRLKFRDDASGDHRANSGVFVRFPRVHGHPEEPRPEWVAITYGHEVQIYDDAAGDQYKTGSIYGFDLVTRGEAMTTPGGVWNDLEIRVIDQHYYVYRNGVLINEFENAPGQLFSPPRADDPGTDGRQHASGYIGLQTHSAADVISYRDIRIKPL
ncbi:OmpL47-type beta-barrel domain-containing protein [Streptomyces sp. 6N223]|uniref:OmpL47-type beta-barrel domain-containing protein n=1 Tax=Streptomyces sp. 6N223 TaxID=3457412 RepID=UPI003FCFF352